MTFCEGCGGFLYQNHAKRRGLTWTRRHSWVNGTVLRWIFMDYLLTLFCFVHGISSLIMLLKSRFIAFALQIREICFCSLLKRPLCRRVFIRRKLSDVKKRIKTRIWEERESDGKSVGREGEHCEGSQWRGFKRMKRDFDERLIIRLKGRMNWHGWRLRSKSFSLLLIYWRSHMIITNIDKLFYK